MLDSYDAGITGACTACAAAMGADPIVAGAVVTGIVMVARVAIPIIREWLAKRSVAKQ